MKVREINALYVTPHGRWPQSLTAIDGDWYCQDTGNPFGDITSYGKCLWKYFSMRKSHGTLLLITSQLGANMSDKISTYLYSSSKPMKKMLHSWFLNLLKPDINIIWHIQWSDIEQTLEMNKQYPSSLGEVKVLPILCITDILELHLSCIEPSILSLELAEKNQQRHIQNMQILCEHNVFLCCLQNDIMIFHIVYHRCIDVNIYHRCIDVNTVKMITSIIKHDFIIP